MQSLAPLQAFPLLRWNVLRAFRPRQTILPLAAAQWPVAARRSVAARQPAAARPARLAPRRVAGEAFLAAALTALFRQPGILAGESGRPARLAPARAAGVGSRAPRSDDLATRPAQPAN